MLPHHNPSPADTENEPLLPAAAAVHHATATRGASCDPARARLVWIWSAVLTAGSWFVYFSLSYADLSDIVAIGNTTFFAVAVLSWVILGERPGWVMCISAVISSIAVICIAQPAFLFGSPGSSAGALKSTQTLGCVLAFLTTFFRATNSILMRKIGPGISTLIPLLAFSITATVMSTIAVVVNGISLAGFTRPSVLFKILMHAAVCLVGQGFFILAIKRIKAASEAMTDYMKIPFSILFQAVVIGTVPSGIKIAAMLAIIGAGVWSIRSDAVPNQPTEPDLESSQDD